MRHNFIVVIGGWFVFFFGFISALFLAALGAASREEERRAERLDYLSMWPDPQERDPFDVFIDDSLTKDDCN